MIVERKKRSGRNEDLYIIRFKDKEEVESILGKLQNYLSEAIEYGELLGTQEVLVDEIKHLSSILNEIEGRLDSVYKTDDYELSTGLFSDKIEILIEQLIYGNLFSMMLLKYKYLNEIVVVKEKLNERMEELILSKEGQIELIQKLIDILHIID